MSQTRNDKYISRGDCDRGGLCFLPNVMVMIVIHSHLHCTLNSYTVFFLQDC